MFVLIQKDLKDKQTFYRIINMGDVEMETKLKKIHKEKGIKQSFVAEKAGLTEGAYSLIVRGESLPSLPSAIKIARVLDTTVENLWGEQI